MDGKYQAYPEYKDSGVDWLERIPRHWIIRKLKHLLTNPLIYGANEAALDDDQKNPRYIRITDMRPDGSLRPETFKSLPIDIAKDYLLRDGDILLARSGATVGKTFLFKKKFGDCCFAGYLIRARCDYKKCISRIIFWFCHSSQYWGYIADSQIQATIQNVSAEKFGNFNIPTPISVTEQTQIANFLDHETAKIDTLIKKQETLIQLLQEKRQAVISHAVTKGLNPDAPTKPSGVAWLGDIPAHWKKRQLKSILKQAKRQGFPDLEVLSVFRDHGVIPKSSRKDNYNKTPEDLSHYQLVNKGDLVINKMKAWQGSLGVSCHEGIISPDYVVFVSSHKEIDTFLHFSLRGSHMPSVYRSISNGIRPSQWRLEPDNFCQLHFFFPGKKEQEEIVEFIEDMTIKYDNLMALAQEQITLLKERRTALISSAVTGKIDVRNWQPPQA